MGRGQVNRVATEVHNRLHRKQREVWPVKNSHGNGRIGAAISVWTERMT